MNKKLLALAIGAAVAMPVAALADGPTLYGKINLSLEQVKDNVASGSPMWSVLADESVWSVHDNASRIGIKGSADTGVSGLQGIYLAEFGLKADDGDANGWGTGADPLTARNIYAGLKGDFGTVLVGNLDTPTKSVQGTVDEFNDTTADMKTYLAGELRAPNIVAYASPKIADSVTITVASWQGEGTADNGSPAQPLKGIADAISASVVYQNEGLYLGLGMDKDVPTTGGIDVNTSVNGSGFNDIMRAVAQYSTDSFEIGGLYQKADDTQSGNSASDTSMLVSGAYKTGDWKFKAQYATTKADLADVTAKMMGIGADYAIGKATTLSANYASLKSDDTPVSQDTTLLGVGLEQRF